MTQLATQVIRARPLYAQHLGRELPGDEGDLDVLQEILDGGFVDRDAT
jgi:hypothetical protein